MSERRLPLIIALGSTQTIAWASTYYLPAIVAGPAARELGYDVAMLFAAFSVAILVSGLVGPRIGRRIDAFGGREVLAVSNLVAAGGLLLFAGAHDLVVAFLAWIVLGLAMGIGLYDAAFATLSRIYGTGARSSITGIALIAGFASTVGWPASAIGVEYLGWRGTCVAWAAVHLAIALPINLLCIPRVARASTSATSAPAPVIAMDRNMWLLGFAFAGIWFVATAMAAHLPRLLELAGATPAQAVAAAALMGPAQVGARVVESMLLTRYHPLLSARLASAAHPVAILSLALFAGMAGGATMAPVFALLHGAGNGILTIARGTVPLAIYGPVDYGYRLGLLGAPGRVTQALAPVAFGLALDQLGASAMLLSGVVGLATLAAFLLVRPPTDENSASPVAAAR